MNLNLTVLIGGLCLAVFVFDRLLKQRALPDRHLIVVSALSAAALLVNPRGPFLLEAALKYRDADALRYQYVFEWMEPELGDVTHLPFLLALLVVPLAAWQLLRLRLWPAVPLLFLAYQSFTAIRFIPIYAMLSLFFAAWLVWQMAPDRREQLESAPPVVPRAAWAPALAVLAVVVVGAVSLRTDASQFRRSRSRPVSPPRPRRS